jgi:tetratricopeptide (TPR) repeat protein
MVFASKARSPYTQMYLTRIDENGQDSPAILIDNATAANRAVNLPEFVNVAPDALERILTPAVEVYRQFDDAVELARKGQYDGAIAKWDEYLKDNPDDARARNNYGAALARAGRVADAIAQYEKALAASPHYHAIHTNLGGVLVTVGRVDEAIVHFRKAAGLYEESPNVHNNLGRALAMKGQFAEAAAAFEKAVDRNRRFVEARYYLGLSLFYSGAPLTAVLEHWREALRVDPTCAPALNSLARVLAASADAADRNGAEAVALAERAVKVSAGPAHLDTLAAAYAEAGRFGEAVNAARRALSLANESGIAARLKLYEAGTPYRAARGELL